MPSPGRLRGEVLVVLSAIGFGAMPYFALTAYAAGLSVPTLLVLRFGIAAAVLAGYLALKRRLRPPSGRLLAVGAAMGGCYAAMSSFYFSSVRYVPPPVTALLLYSYPALVAIASAALARRRPSRSVIAALTLSAAGIALAIGPRQLTFGPDAWLGIAFGLAAPVVYTCYILIGDRFAHGLSMIELTFWVSVSAAAALLVQGAASGGLQWPPPAAGWPPALAVAVLSTVLAVGAFLVGVRAVGPTKASIISTVEPVATWAIGAAGFGYAVTLDQVVGTALVLAGATVASLSGRPARQARQR